MAARNTLPAQFAFNSGELSPLLLARTDQARYAYGARRMRNFIPTLQGPARKRGGFKFLAEIGDSSAKAWCVPFIFSQRDAYILEFGDGYVRFYTDHGQVLESAQTIASMTNASPGVFTKTGHGLSVDEEIYIATMPGTTGIAGRNFRVNSTPTADTFTLKDLYGTVLNTTSLGTYTGSGTFERIYQIVSPYSTSDLTDSATGCCKLSYAQSGDVMYLCLAGFAVRKLTRTAPTSWAFSTFDPQGGPFEPVDPDATTTVYASGETGSGVTLTASSAIFTANHVGALFLLERKLTEIVTSWEPGKSITAGNIRRSQGHYYAALNSDTTGAVTPSHTEGSRYDGNGAVNWEYLHSGYGWAKITAIGGGGTTATADVISRIPSGAVGSGNATTRWAFGEWSAANGHPTCVTFFRERLTFARGTQVWFSVPADFENFAERNGGVIATDSAFVMDIRTGVNDEILWMMPTADLLVGTEGGEQSIAEITTSEAFGPGNAAALAGPGYGSRQVRPVKVNDSAIYVQNAGRNVRELRFTFETNGYSSLERTAFAEHIARGKINQLAFAKQPGAIVWAACANGDLIGMSIQHEHDLLAWHKHPLGGGALVESLAVIPSPDGDHDELYLIASLTVNSQTKRYLGYLVDDWDEDEHDAEDMFFLDFGLTYDSTPAATITNAHHLEGKTVKVFADARYVGEKTVTAGAVTLDSEASVVQLGLAYTATLESMNVMRPGFLGRAVHSYVRFRSTIAALWSTITQRERASETGTPRAFEFGNVSVSAAAAPVTRLVRAPGESGHARDLTWVIEHTEPSACIVSGVALEMAEQ